MAEQNDPMTTRSGVPFFHLRQVGKMGGAMIHFTTVQDWKDGVAYANLGSRWPEGQRMTRPDEAGTPAVRVYRGNLQHARTVLLGLLSIVLGSDENKVHGVAGLPSGTVGIDGDLSVDPTTGTIYIKANGTWSQWSSGSVVAPSLVSPPVISGTPQVGQTLTATAGVWLNSPTLFTRQWRRNGTPISGAVDSTYVPVTADIGTTLTIEVLASNAAGPAAQAAVSAGVGPVQAAVAPAPVNQTPPSLTGSQFRVGVPLTVNVGTWSNSPTSYSTQVLRNGVEIVGATGSTYTPVQADVDTLLSVRVIATNGTPSQPATSATVGPVLSNLAGPPSIGTVTAGDGNVTVTWLAPASNGGSPITGYLIRWSGGQTKTVGNVLSGAVTGLANGIPGTVTVRAITANGQGEESAPSPTVTPTASTVTLSRFVADGDSNTIRQYDTVEGSVNASGGVATATMPTAREVYVGETVLVYAPGVKKSFSGYVTITERLSTTQFRWAYSGPDTAVSESWSFAFMKTQTEIGYVTWMSATLDGRLDMLKSAGVGGETSAQGLARFDADVISQNPEIVAVMFGGNDAAAGVPAATTQANLSAMYDKLRAQGIKIIAMTPRPANANSGAQVPMLTAVSQWVRDQVDAHPNDMRLVDVYGLGVDPDTQAQKPGMTYDGAHFAPDFARRIGIAAATAAASFNLKPKSWVINNPGNVVTNSLFTDTNSDGVADGCQFDGTNGSTNVTSIIPNAYGSGNMQRIVTTHTGVGGYGAIRPEVNLAGLTPGKKYRLRMRVHASGPVIRNLIAGVNMVSEGRTIPVRAITSHNTAASGTLPYSEVIDGVLFSTEPFLIPTAGLTDFSVRIGLFSSGAGVTTLGAAEVFTEEVSGSATVTIDGQPITVDGEVVTF